MRRIDLTVDEVRDQRAEGGITYVLLTGTLYDVRGKAIPSAQILVQIVRTNNEWTERDSDEFVPGKKFTLALGESETLRNKNGKRRNDDDLPTELTERGI